MKGVYVDTLYSLLLALLIVGEENVCYFIGKNIDSNIAKRMKNSVYLKDITSIKCLSVVINKYRIIFKLKSQKFEEIYLQDHILFSQLFLNKFIGKILLLEDGLRNYNEKIIQEEYKMKDGVVRKDFKGIMKRLLFLDYKKYRTTGTSEKVDSILLTNLERIPESIENKVQIVNPKKKLSNLEKGEGKRILEIFGINRQKVENIKREKRKLVLFTQPLSEDNILDEEEKLKLYSEIVSNYSLDELVIKPHPREKTNYLEYFQGVAVIDKNIPMELLGLVGIKFEKYITIFSSAAKIKDKNVQVDWYGTKIHPKLLEEFGDI